MTGKRSFCISPNLDRLLYLIGFHNDLHGHIEGTKKIVKLVWLAKVEEKVKFDYDFATKHWWPPHDDRLDTDIDVLCNLDLVRAELKTRLLDSNPNTSHSYSLTDYGRVLLKKHIERNLGNPEADLIKTTVSNYGVYNDPELTLLALSKYRR